MGKPISRSSKKLVFFDRDGVILKEVIRSDGTKGSISLQKEFEYLAHVKETFKFCEDSDFFTVLASNQPDISRKLVSSDFVKKINETILEQLSMNIAVWCPHSELDQCLCRKPLTNMFEQIVNDFKNLDETYFIGDRLTDMEVAIKLKIKGIHLVPTLDEFCDCGVEYHVKNLMELVEILSDQNNEINS